MAEKDTIFSSSVKSTGIFPFRDFYNFCYDWLTEEIGLDVSEEKYKEKLSGNEKEIEIVWVGTKKVTDYFKFEVKVDFIIKHMVDVELVKDSVKRKSNKGEIQ